MTQRAMESRQLRIEPGLQNFRLSESRDGNRYGLLGIEAEAGWCDVIPDAALQVVDPPCPSGEGSTVRQDRDSPVGAGIPGAALTRQQRVPTPPGRFRGRRAPRQGAEPAGTGPVRADNPKVSPRPGPSGRQRGCGARLASRGQGRLHGGGGLDWSRRRRSLCRNLGGSAHPGRGRDRRQRRRWGDGHRRSRSGAGGCHD